MPNVKLKPLDWSCNFKPKVKPVDLFRHGWWDLFSCLSVRSLLYLILSFLSYKLTLPTPLTCFTTSTKHIPTVGSRVHTADSANSLVSTDAQPNSKLKCHKALQFPIFPPRFFFLFLWRKWLKTMLSLPSSLKPKSIRWRKNQNDSKCNRASEATTKKKDTHTALCVAGFLWAFNTLIKLDLLRNYSNW